jgi:hypothetical protein
MWMMKIRRHNSAGSDNTASGGRQPSRHRPACGAADIKYARSSGVNFSLWLKSQNGRQSSHSGSATGTRCCWVPTIHRQQRAGRSSQRIPPLTDVPAGFDRAAFHRDFNASVVGFLREHLAGDGEAR